MREKVSNIYYVAGKSNYQLSIISYCTYFAMALGSVILLRRFWLLYTRGLFYNTFNDNLLGKISK